MTNQHYFIVGKLGKPHSLKGFQYINIEHFFRNFDLKEITLQIDGVNFIVEEFKIGNVIRSHGYMKKITQKSLFENE